MSGTVSKEKATRRGGARMRKSAAVGLAMALIVTACASDDNSGDPAAQAATEEDAGTEENAGTEAGADASGLPESPGTEATPDEYEAYMAELHEQAIEEGGTVVVYTHLTPPEPRAELISAFEEAYPGVTVEATAAVGGQILERLLTEKRADVDDVDVFKYPGSFPFLFDLEDEGFLAEYTPTSADYYPDDLVIPGKAYPWTTYHIAACYNTNLVTDEEVELLHSYEGWVDPVWEDRANIVGTTGGTNSRAIHIWANDPDLGWDWLEGLAAHNPTVYADINSAIERLVAGEYAVAFNNLSVSAARQFEVGAPVRCAFPEYVPTIPAPVGIITDAPHPAAARLYTEWTLSEDGQIAAQEAGKGISSREGMEEHPVLQEPWWETPPAIKSVDEAALAEDFDELESRFIETFGGLGN